MNESEFQAFLIGAYDPRLRGFAGGYCQLVGWRAQHVEKVTMRGYGNRVITKTPGTKGYPDLTLARKGKVAFIELKADDGHIDEQQFWWLEELSGCDCTEFDKQLWASRTAVPKARMLTSEGWVVGADPPSTDWHVLVAVVRPRHRDWIVKALR